MHDAWWTELNHDGPTGGKEGIVLSAQVSQQRMGPEVASSPWESDSRANPEGPRVHKRRRGSHEVSMM